MVHRTEGGLQRVALLARAGGGAYRKVNERYGDISPTEAVRYHSFNEVVKPNLVTRSQIDDARRSRILAARHAAARIERP